jgi:membrane-associated protease RseP (regulator of RpoE activity)
VRKGRNVAVAAALLVTAVPALADKIYAVTPSGAAETLFPENPETVTGKLASHCIDVKWSVTSSTATEVVCEAALNMGQSILGQMLLGNSYSTPPRRFFRFNVAEVNGISRVQASGWMELQMAFGQVKRTDFSGAEFQNSIMIFMGGAGGKLPPGTTFPNHAYLGVKDTPVDLGKRKGLSITEIDPASAAEKGGLHIGDIITKIAGKGFKSSDDLLDAAAKAAEKPTCQVEFIREGKPMQLTVERTFRPAFTEPVVAAQNAEPTATSPVPQISVADELAKLAKLRDEGILTDAEFETQKAKLLGK